MSDLNFELVFIPQKVQNETYIEMINRVLDTPFFYFSYTYDLSHTLQRLYSIPAEFNEVTFDALNDETLSNLMRDLFADGLG